MSAKILGVMFFLGCGAPPSGDCVHVGSSCSLSSECCGVLECSTSHVCAEASQELCTTESCSAGNYEICTSYYKTGSGQKFLCMSPGNCTSAASQISAWCQSGTPSCKTAYKECSGQSECCPDLVCSKTGRCKTASNLPLGEACSANNQCESGNCNGSWCTTDCVDRYDCGSGTSCMSTATGDYCFPLCSSTLIKCSVFGSEFSCISAQSADGLNSMVCSI